MFGFSVSHIAQTKCSASLRKVQAELKAKKPQGQNHKGEGLQQVHTKTTEAPKRCRETKP